MSFLKKLTKIFTPVDSRRKPRPKKVFPKRDKRPLKRKEAVSPKFNARVLQQAQAKAREIIIEAKDEAYRLRQEVDKESRKLRETLDKQKEAVQQKQAEIERLSGRLEEKERLLDKKEDQLEERFSEIEKIKANQLEKLERVAGLTRDEAKKLILEATEKKLKSEIGRKIKETEEESKKRAEEKSREILVDSMYHGATDYVAEYTVSIVKLTDDEMKGRIIGKEGRNIRTFEKVTGVDVDLDEEEVIRLSCFDPVRREVAKVALEKLLRDGRIQPSRIEEVVKKTQEDVERIMLKAGEDLCHRLRVYNLPRPIIEILGRFKYRFSYGQNMIAHTLEESNIGIALAEEIKANVNEVRLGCLLHDIGKVIIDDEGTHVQIGVNFLKKHNIPQAVIDCVSQHHQDEEFTSPEAVLVYIADAISGARPGARYKDYEGYVKRLEDLEELAKSFSGVKEAYAIQAGREIRVIVDPEKRNDTATYKLASDIRDKVKKELAYPGQVKVTVIRELRKIEVAN